MLHRVIPIVAGSAVLFTIALAVAWYSSATLTTVRGNRFDFYPRYVGGQAVWSGESPYSRAVTERIQTGMFGSLLPESADQYRFAYPAYTAWLIAPFLLAPPSTAIALWIGVQFTAVLASVLIIIVIERGHPSPWVLGLYIIGVALLFRYPINMLVVGQFTGGNLLLVVLASTCWAARRGWRMEVLAGVLLVLATAPPTFTAPFALLMLGIRTAWGKPCGLLAFAAALSVLTALTTMQIGWWIGDFLEGVRAYSEYSFPVWAPGLIPMPLSLGVVVLAFASIAWGIRAAQQQQDVLLLAGAGIIAVLLLVPQTGSYTLTFALLPLTLVFNRLGRLKRPGRVLAAVGMIAFTLSPWLYANIAPGLEMLGVPLHLLVLYIPVMARAR